MSDAKTIVHQGYTWFWCDLCMCPAVHFPCCNNISCNGGGCDVCCPKDTKNADGWIVNEIYQNSQAPYDQLRPEDAEERSKKYLDNLFPPEAQII